ncbi:MAG TPA: hypothetical protein VGB77_11290 [Abditibacteriaceae bacterium]|jgi:hypothetical protein
MNPLDLLFGQVRREIEQHASPNTPGPSYDAGGLLNILGGLFGQQAQNQGHNFDPDQAYNQAADYQPQYGNVLPASQDPYGDPADQGGGQYGNVLPASQDPYGDPADQERR